MKTNSILPAFLIALLFCPLVRGQEVQQSQNPEKILEEFFNLKPSRKKLIDVLKSGAKEPFKTKIIEKILAGSPSPNSEEASDILTLKPREPYTRRLWEIVEANGSLNDWCKVSSSGPEEYQGKAFALIFGRRLIMDEYVFYLMRFEYQPRYARQIWDGFMKLNPGKEGFLFAARNARGDFQEVAILQLLYLYLSQELKLETPELSEIFELIAEVEKKRAEKKEIELIEIITQKCDQ